jgi:methyl-accepting chemotaxis protein
MLDNLRFRGKLVLVLALPIVALAAFSVSVVGDRSKAASSMETLEDLAAISADLSALVHELQKERGLTAGFLSSRGTKFAGDLDQQRRLSDRARADLEAGLVGDLEDAFGAEFASSIGRVQQKLGELDGTRRGVSNMSTSQGEAIAYYTSTNGQMIDIIGQSSLLATNVDISVRLGAYQSLILGKERAGIERAIGNGAFARDHFNGPVDFNRFVSLSAMQSAYFSAFLSAATDEERSEFDRALAGPVSADVDRFRTAGWEAGADVALGQDAGAWMGASTRRIDALKTVEDFVAEGLIARAEEVRAAAKSSLVWSIIVALFSIGGALFLGWVIGRNITRRMSAVTDLAQSVRSGEFSELATGDEAEDEIGELTRAFEGVCAIVSDVVAEVARVSSDVSAGDLSSRGNVDGFSGSYRGVVDGVNDLVDSLESTTQQVKQDAAVAQGFLDDLGRVISAVADRDLSVRMTGAYRADFAEVQTAFNSAVENLDTTLTEVVAATEQVTAAAEEIADGAQSLAEGASDQASSIEEISASLMEMSGMAQQNMANATEARSLSESAGRATTEGVDNMRQLSDAVESIKGSSDATAKVVKTIDEIAFQTNLLALNAAVEAARAGDAGKGFAVVAEEVRNLAMRSAEAAQDTAELIEDAVRNAESGVTHNQEAIQSLGEIEQGISRVREVMTEVSEASNQQTQGVSEISKAVEQMNGVTQSVAANAEESASAAEELSSQSQLVYGLVGGFTLTNGGGRRVGPSVGPSAPGAYATRTESAPRSTNGAGSGPEMVNRLEDLIPFDDDAVLGEF